MLALPWAAPLLVQALVLAGILAGGGWAWSGLALILGVIPLLDHGIGEHPEDPPQPETAWHRLWLRFTVPLQGVMMIVAVRAATDPSLALSTQLGAVLSCGVACGGFGIVAAHELFHRHSKWDRALGECLMASVQYAPYVVEHVYGHHLAVGTPTDAVSAPRGRGLWAQLPHSIDGTLRNAWRLERTRAQRRTGSGFFAGDRRLRWVLWPMLTFGLTGALAGFSGMAALATIAIVAVLLLETVNYIEHYGLRRAQLANGDWEPQGAQHSWDSEHRLTRWLLFGLPRHAAHHLRASKPYPELEHRVESPKMPTGYAGMVLLALVPPLWRKVMNERIPNARELRA